MPAQLTPEVIAIVKATAPALRVHGLDITLRMYEHLFENDEVRALFNPSHQGATGSQPKALALAVLAYAENIDNLAAMGPAVERIAQKHVSLSILPEHYPFVATALLKAIADVLGDAATDAVLNAWGEAYWFLAEILIGREGCIYRDLAAVPGGWIGWRQFRIEKVEQESTVIRSYYLRPVDGGPVVRHKPGQYLTLRLDLDGQVPLKRNYTISCAPNDAVYRISVKREDAPAGAGVPAGAASTWLHNLAEVGTVLQVAPPAGDFFLDTAAAHPVVLVSGGVGLTPMISMLETIAANRPDLPTWYVHGALNPEVHAMKHHVRELAARSGNINVKVFYADGAGDRARTDNDNEEGLITAEWLAGNTPRADAVYFLCGPKPFLRDLTVGLMRAGVPADRIRYEFFGPPDDLLAA